MLMAMNVDPSATLPRAAPALISSSASNLPLYVAGGVFTAAVILPVVLGALIAGQGKRVQGGAIGLAAAIVLEKVFRG